MSADLFICESIGCMNPAVEYRYQGGWRCFRHAFHTHEPKRNDSTMMTVTDVARICHAANAELCRINGDWTQAPWESAPEWAQESARNGVVFHVEHPESTPEDSHRNWMREKAAAGWVCGEEKNPEAKTHPCMVPYDQLPPEQRAKDYLFRAVVHALKPFMAPPPLPSKETR